MTSFLRHSKNSINERAILERNYSYSVWRSEDGKEAFMDRLPKWNSKYWVEFEYLVWDNKNNHVVRKPKVSLPKLTTKPL